jgi:Na+-transporting NADH:ubiquinone oxidoreductase subunit NqrD
MDLLDTNYLRAFVYELGKQLSVNASGGMSVDSYPAMSRAAKATLSTP